MLSLRLAKGSTTSERWPTVDAGTVAATVPGADVRKANQAPPANSIAITAAEPGGLWGLLKESFAGGTELAKAKMNPGTDALIKAVVEDFGTDERTKPATA